MHEESFLDLSVTFSTTRFLRLIVKYPIRKEVGPVGSRNKYFFLGKQSYTLHFFPLVSEALEGKGLQR